MEKLKFICKELQISKKLLVVNKSRIGYHVRSLVYKRWIAILFYHRLDYPISKIARIMHFDRSSIYNCFHKATDEQKRAAEMLHKMYTHADYIPPQVIIYQTQLVPDYLHSRVVFKQVRIN